MTQSTKSNPKPRPDPHVRFVFDAIGTKWRIDLFQALRSKRIDQLHRAIRARIETFDAQYSRFRDDSFVSEMSRRAGEYTLSADARPMLDLYAELYRVTDGLVTPLVGRLLVEAGYDANYSFRPGTLHRPLSWDEVLEYQFPKLTVRRPVLLDFGAAGKGYLVDIIGGVLEAHGVGDYSIDAGGDILHRGHSQPLRVGLEHPGDTQQAIGVATIANQSICASAPTRRKWGAFHHIMDPKRLESVQGVRAVWTVANTALLADALATCLFFVPPAALQTRYTFAYALVADDFSLTHSADFPATFFTTKGSSA
ncbi:MAG TPA: FAD:protein FMN transferase [Candidatus Saccharimonadales bacterium]|nr:FAD:protein FMN transferase [Candidatus Saccharimonadales bacterium]